MTPVSAFFSLLFFLAIFQSIFSIQQVHLSLGYDETSMLVTWTVPEQKHSEKSTVEYRCHGQENRTAEAIVELLDDDAANYRTYRALLYDLPANQSCEYTIKMAEKSSGPYQFRTIPSGSEWLPRLAIYGDFGFVNERSIPYLKKDVQNDMYDAIFHIGDFAYDLPDDKGYVGHKFMRTIESIASKIPYMTCPGNHEEYHNFSHYDSRFSMLADRYDRPPSSKLSLEQLNNHFWSIDIGPAHIILFSTEYYYYTEYGWNQIIRQYEWLKKDLERANENRKERPWLIVMGHRPLYCLKMGDDSCNHRTLEREDIRRGVHWHGHGGERQYGLEDLFFKYGVDLQFYGHEHFYARMLPMYNYTIKSGKKSTNPYDHPEGPIYITTGSAGNVEQHPPFNHIPSWTACHFLDYGYTRLLFQDRYHIRLEQVSDDEGGIVLDSIDIIKSSPQPKWMT